MTSSCRVVRIVVVLALASIGVSCAEDGVAGNVLKITEREYVFEVEGEPRSGTLTIDVENTGEEWHELAIAKLLPGKTVADKRKALEDAKEDDDQADGVTEEDSVIDDLGGNQFPGTAYAITGSGIEPGNYVLMCYVPNAKGKPHWSLGMLTGFTIGDDENAEAPEADVTFTVDDKRLDGPKQIDDGRTTLSVVNGSKVTREIGLFKVKDGKTLEDVNESFGASGDAPPDPATAPLDFFAYVFDAEQDRSITLDLTPGQWAINASDPENPPELAPDKDPFAVVFTVA